MTPGLDALSVAKVGYSTMTAAIAGRLVSVSTHTKFRKDLALLQCITTLDTLYLRIRTDGLPCLVVGNIGA